MFGLVAEIYVVFLYEIWYLERVVLEMESGLCPGDQPSLNTLQ
jgi:hypothetical protein